MTCSVYFAIKHLCTVVTLLEEHFIAKRCGGELCDSQTFSCKVGCILHHFLRRRGVHWCDYFAKWTVKMPAAGSHPCPSHGEACLGIFFLYLSVFRIKDDDWCHMHLKVTPSSIVLLGSVLWVLAHCESENPYLFHFSTRIRALRCSLLIMSVSEWLKMQGPVETKKKSTVKVSF